ncbi:nucleotidyltransferase domain-containing protein [Sulfolobus tengchongensis]|uniref:Nucleotidyltransferase domain-containing protein n=1 Tax=Sulfolobus tengchongensis TaxID=207809 RepID=A0AAX4L1I6_9CREN
MLEKVLEERKKKREEVINRVREFAEELKRRFGKVSVVLYGSYARGDFNLWSDIDVIVISEGFEGIRFLDRYDLLGIREGFEIKPYTPREFMKIKDKIGWKEALKDSIVICDDYSIFIRGS